ncbi:MAG: hypothetical protein OXN27_07090 [Candidatus Poribacteria bacterium]|nr:hypothetical protein [Candidatus Poribacteria bacterium]
MNDGFDDEQDSSQPPSEMADRIPELNARQREIYQNLKSIGPEIAAYYLDGIRILQRKDLETSASLLAHIAREIDGGLRDILSEDPEEKLEFVIRVPDDEKLRFKGKRADTFEFTISTPGTVEFTYKDIPRHRISILRSLGIDDPSPLAERWINVTRNFARFAHRHGAWRSPRGIEDFEGLWLEFEGVLAGLVGNYLNLLDRLDRIQTAEPTRERRGALRNLLESEARRAYFFRKLESLTWLEPLKEDGWFDPDRNPMPQESPDQPGYYYSSRWHELEYLVKISTHPECPIDILVDIVNAITDESRERIDNGRTDLDTVKIIGILPIERIEPQHIAFMGAALKSSQKYGLMDQEIGQTILPKLLDGRKRELTLALLPIMLEVEFVDGRIRPIMSEHWLEDALKRHGRVIANLCGVEAAQIGLTQIRALAAEDSSVFHFIHPVESNLSDLSRANYAELIVSFTSSIFQSAELVSITETIQGLLYEPHIIIRRIAVRAITDHYSDLKHLFWGWEGNPLDEVGLEPVISHLIQTNSHTFSESEMEQILQWIESTQY